MFGDDQSSGASNQAETGQSLQGLPQEPGQEQQTQYVTAVDLEQKLAAERETILRAIQGMTDKQENRIEKRLKAWEDKLGYQPSEALRERAREQLALEELQTVDVAETAQFPQRQQIDPVVLKTVNQKLEDLSTKYDQFIHPDNPKFRGIDFSFANPPDKFLREVEERLAGKQTVQQPPAGNAGHVSFTNTGAGSGGVEQMNKRLLEIQEQDPFRRNKELTKERVDILERLKSFG